MSILVPTGGQQLTVNGVDLSQYAVILDSRSPLMHVPKKRQGNVTVPGRHGTIHIPNKRYDESTVVLTLLVLGAQPDGTVPNGSTAAQQFYMRADALAELFSADTVALARTMPDGTTRTATAEVLDVMDFTRNLGDAPLLGQVKVALTIPGAFWTSAGNVSATITGVTGTTASLAVFAPATAPMTVLTVTFGPCSNPKITQGATSLQYNGVIGTGQQLVVDTGLWTLGTGTGTAWTPSYANISYAPGPPWFSLDPTRSLTTTLTHTAGGSATVTIAGRLAYMTG